MWSAIVGREVPVLSPSRRQADTAVVKFVRPETTPLRATLEAARRSPTETVTMLRTNVSALWGARLDVVSPEMAAARRMPAGVIVEQVPAGSVGYTSGLRVGDVILRIGGAQVRSVMDVRRLVEANATKPVELEIDRGGRTRKLVITTKR